MADVIQLHSLPLETSEHIGPYKAHVIWYPALTAIYTSPEGRARVIALIEAEFLHYETTDFSVCYTVDGRHEVIWRSEYDKTSDTIHIDAHLSLRFERDENGRIVSLIDQETLI